MRNFRPRKRGRRVLCHRLSLDIAIRVVISSIHPLSFATLAIFTPTVDSVFVFCEVLFSLVYVIKLKLACENDSGDVHLRKNVTCTTT
ncbi:Uncharacterized protein APZ42_011051 [Daphnia magna]|uniref:Uncharacterized protein n=1 Tax=Daphnia magna TaxID=35525 RepID=A0A162T5B5_9CRUS|nr:Uncharacterized protein APZ42_011051 [Daphnia magna]